MELRMHRKHEKSETQPSSDRSRHIKNAAFCWQQKAALARINEGFAEAKCVASGRSVYVAMTQLASDAQSETFTSNIALIGHKAGLSYHTVEKILKGLEELGLIAIRRVSRASNSGLIKAPSTYTLLAIGNGCSSTIGNGQKHGSVADKDKQSGTTNDNNGVANASAIQTFGEATKHPLWPKFVAYCRSKGGSPTLNGFNTWLKSHPAASPKSPSGKNGPSYEERLRASREQADRKAGIVFR
jgi:hypothetical protein